MTAIASRELVQGTRPFELRQRILVGDPNLGPRWRCGLFPERLLKKQVKVEQLWLLRHRD